MMTCSSRMRFSKLRRLLQSHPDADLIYSDEDKLTEDGYEKPLLKPDWSPDYFLSYNYLCHFTIVRARSLLEKVGPFKPEFDGAQDYDLFLARKRANPADPSYAARALSLAAHRYLHRR